MIGKSPLQYLLNLIAMYVWAPVRSFIIRRGGMSLPTGLALILLGVETIFGLAYLYGYENFSTVGQDAFDRLTNSSAVSIACYFLGWILFMGFHIAVAHEAYRAILERLSEILVGERALYNTASVEFSNGLLVAVLTGLMAYFLDGRVNSFDTSFWPIDVGLRFLISASLWLSPIAAMFVALSAFKIRSGSKPFWTAQ